MSRYSLGVDIGGTFTDIVMLTSEGTLFSRKLLSTPRDYSLAIEAGVAALLGEAGIEGSGDPAARSRHHGRDQRDHRAQGRAHRPHHDPRFPRRARARAVSLAAALRSRVPQARAARRAPPALRGHRALRRRGQRARAACAGRAGRDCRGDREPGRADGCGVLHQRSRQPGQRAGSRALPGAAPAAGVGVGIDASSCRRSASTSAPAPPW